MTIHDDGYADGGRPYSDDELDLIEEIEKKEVDEKMTAIPDEPKKGLTERDFKNTLQMMDACNGAALIKDLAEIVPRVWEESEFYGNKGTAWVVQHPVILLWVSKIASLSYGEEAPIEKWTAAYNYVKARLDGLEVGKNTPMWLPEGGYPRDE